MNCGPSANSRVATACGRRCPLGANRGPAPHLRGPGAARATGPRNRLPMTPLRHPASLHYPQPDGLHIKFTAEAYFGSLQRPLRDMGVVRPPGLPQDMSAARPSAAGPLACGGARIGTGRDDQEENPGGHWPRVTASISPESRVTGHLRGNAVKHVSQSCFELSIPAVLGVRRALVGPAAGRQGVADEHPVQISKFGLVRPVSASGSHRSPADARRTLITRDRLVMVVVR